MSNPLPRYPPALWLLFLGRVITATGYSFSFPFFAIYAVHHLRVPTGTAGLAILLSGAAGALARLCGGELADVIGRKPVMLVALAGRAVTAALIAWEIHGDLGFLPVAGTFIASNFVGQLFEPASQAWIADVATGPLRTESFGFLRMGVNAGWGLGLALNAVVTESYVLAFAVTAGLFALALLLFALFLSEPAKAPRPPESVPPWSSILANRPFVLLAAGAVLMSIAWSQLVPGTSFYASNFLHFPEKQIKFLLALNGILVVLLQIPATRLMARAGLVPSLVAGCLLFAAGYASYAFCTTPWHFALAIVAVSCAEVLVVPGGASLATELAPDSQRGRFLGLYTLSQSSGHSFGPALSGGLLQHFPTHPAITWFTIAGSALASAAVHLVAGKWIARSGRTGPKCEAPLE